MITSPQAQLWLTRKARGPGPLYGRSLNLFSDTPKILRGVPEVAAAADQMDALRVGVGQGDDLSTDIRLILSRHNSNQRQPVVVVLGSGGVSRAAVIFLERCWFGVGMGLLRAGDPTGDGAVIAAAPEREAALLAGIAAVLGQRRCHTAAASLSGNLTAFGGATEGPAFLRESSDRTVRRHLPLCPSLDETLRQRFTPRKRKNLLYYRRKLFSVYAAEFVPDIPKTEIEAALVELSANSWPMRTAREMALHSEFLRQHPECFAMGIRLKSGPWLSLVTGWRAAGTTHMPWQLNHENYKHASLMQVMRTCVMEHEGIGGQFALSWVGGTVSFQSACLPEACLDVLASRRGIRSAVLRHVVAPLLYRREPDAFESGSLMLLLRDRHKRV